MSTSILHPVRRHTGPSGPNLVPFHRQASSAAAAHALRFLELLGQEAADEGVILVDLKGAVSLLYHPRLYRRGALRHLAAEVERHTRGQAFRVDTTAGPLFLDKPLWRFAGESGTEFGEADTWTDRPTWPASAVSK
jgi:hypothetical protein